MKTGDQRKKNSKLTAHVPPGPARSVSYDGRGKFETGLDQIKNPIGMNHA